MLVSSNSLYHPLLSYGYLALMTTLCILVMVCTRVLGFTNWRLLEHSWGHLSFTLWIVAKLLYFYLCLLDAIVELHDVDEKMFIDFLIGK